MKIYTRSGDKGMTSLANGHRVKKCDDRVEAYGTLDELCSHVGLLAAMCPEELRENLYNIQRRIFAINGALALLKEPKGLPTAETIEAMEQLIDSVDTASVVSSCRAERGPPPKPTFAAPYAAVPNVPSGDWAKRLCHTKQWYISIGCPTFSSYLPDI